ncbi:MAG: cupin domain-containing protein [Haloferacaceae archaeon]
MGYHHVDPSTLPAAPDRPCTKRSVSDACDLENLAVHVYEVDPGEEIPLAYHYHDEQEELFHVTEGELHVDTPDREYVVGAGEAFVVEPESPQFAFVPEDGEPTTALVVGAPPIDDVHPYEGD